MNIKYLSPQLLDQAITLSDLTDPRNGSHALQILISELHKALSEKWSCHRMVYRSCPVVTTRDNHDDLGYPPSGASRDARYTRYLSNGVLLRTQTSAAILRLLRSIVLDPPKDLLIACPGLVYRRDVIDRLHVGEPHQLDLWRVTRGKMTKRDLEEMIQIVVETALPGRSYRTNDAVHPYTVQGVQVDVEIDGEWVEVGECGLADPGLLQRLGMGSEISGLAMGLGLDRLLMIRKQIKDIRLLRSNDPRVSSQMQDLELYKVVSNQPGTVRDLSVCVDSSLTDEEIGDKVRESLESDLDSLEELTLKNSTNYEELPQSARDRMGMLDNQKNVLVSLLIRHPVKTLTTEEANRLRDRVYVVLHEGTRQELTGKK